MAPWESKFFKANKEKAEILNIGELYSFYFLLKFGMEDYKI